MFDARKAKYEEKGEIIECEGRNVKAQARITAANQTLATDKANKESVSIIETVWKLDTKPAVVDIDIRL